MDIKDIRIRIGDLGKLPGVGKKTTKDAMAFVSEHPDAFGVDLDAEADDVTAPIFLYNEDTGEFTRTNSIGVDDFLNKGFVIVDEDEYKELRTEHFADKDKSLLSPVEEDMDEWIEHREAIHAGNGQNTDMTIATLIDSIRHAGRTPNIPVLKQWETLLNERVEEEEADEGEWF